MAIISNSTRVWSTDDGEFVVALVVLGFISLLGLVGNSIVVFIIMSSRRNGQRSPVQLFLLHLAISDLMVCILNIPLTIWVNFNYPEEKQSAGDGVCKLTRFLQFLAPSSSICLLTVISIDRYYSLVRPLQAMKRWLRPKVLIATGWFYAIVVFLPTFYFARMEEIESEDKTLWYCRPVPNNTLPGFLYLVFLLIFAFLLQLITIIVLYSRVGKAVWSRERKISRSGTVSTANAASLDKTKRRVTQMLLIVVICFLACWAPFVIYSSFIERFVTTFPNPSDSVRVITYGFGLFNSVCNPFIYFFNSPSFRRDSLKKICLEAAASGGTTRHRLDYAQSTMRTTVVSRSETIVRFQSENQNASEIGKKNEACEPETYNTRL